MYCRFHLLRLQQWRADLISPQHLPAAVDRALSGEKMGHFYLPHPLLHLHSAPSSYLCPVSLCYWRWSQQGLWIRSHSPCPAHGPVPTGQAEESPALCSCLVLALALVDLWPLPATQRSRPAALLCHLPGTQLYPLLHQWFIAFLTPFVRDYIVRSPYYLYTIYF